ncbi:MAG: histidine phosphatase family protein [Alicyclobacillus herbarius]|uniref:histidine phosphatase family protein n=1 Tax=Alicyclobacillus herbarius TaxID=122960 RepID=UPI0023549868|nr:histidine phosphatase family protein [Alicyclobacillus herbarius]MCL6631639.1 histidine phosphatase family protein [Alicyclobacillus herbarius]
MLEFWLIRHGETDWNVEHRIQGWTNIPLNTNGLHQAAVLSESLEGIPFQAIYTSDLDRALVTARILARRIPAPVHITDGLREQCLGEAEGLLRSVANQRFPNGAPSREPEAQMRQRLLKVIQRITTDVRQGRVLCVSHGGLIRAWLTYLGQPAPALGNTSITRFALGPHGWRVMCVNCQDHLPYASGRIFGDVDHPLPLRQQV